MFLKWDLVPRWEQKSQPVVFDIYRRSNILRSHMEAGDVKLGHCLLQLHLHHIQGHDGGKQNTRATNTLLIQTLHAIGDYVQQIDLMRCHLDRIRGDNCVEGFSNGRLNFCSIFRNDVTFHLQWCYLYVIFHCYCCFRRWFGLFSRSEMLPLLLLLLVVILAVVVNSRHIKSFMKLITFDWSWLTHYQPQKGSQD